MSLDLFRTSARPSLSAFIIFTCLAGFAPTAVAQTAHFTYAQSDVFGMDAPNDVAMDNAGNLYVALSTSASAVKETWNGTGYTESTFGSGLYMPMGIAVDSNGNIYIADSGNGRVVKETLNPDGTYSQQAIGVGLYYPQDVTVDLNGKVYIADLNPSRIVRLSPVGSDYEQKTFPVSMYSPQGLAVDTSGNLYIAANGLPHILKWTWTGSDTYTASNIGSDFNQPKGVAIDGNGNIYVADTMNARVVKETWNGSSYIQSDIGSVSQCWGVAVDPLGRFAFVTGPFNNRVVKLVPGGGVDFGQIQVGANSATTTLLFTFDTPGTIAAPAVLTMGAPNMEFADAATGSCTANGTSHSYAAGDTCTVNVQFTPYQAGTRNGAVVLRDNSGVPIATAYTYGSGNGPQVAFAPPKQSTVSDTISRPFGVAVDGSGSLYIVSKAVHTVLYKETASESGYSQSTIPLTTSDPYAMAVDGAGNLYVADGTGNRVLKATPSGGTYASSVIADNANNGLGSTDGVAVDGSGNVYIADTGNGRVLKETLTAGSYIQSTVAESLVSPGGVAVDGSGNVYIAESGGGRILKERPSGGSYVQTVIDTGINLPMGIAVDGTGNVYVVNIGSPNVAVKETLSGGTYSRSTIASGLRLPYGVAVDGVGNVYITNAELNGDLKYLTLKEDVVTPPTLTFASTAVGSQSSDSPKTVTVLNNGNATLTFLVPTSGNNPSVSNNFTWDTTSSTCSQLNPSSSPAILVPGANCTIGINFEPTTEGEITGSVEVTDDDLNADPDETQRIHLAGTATSGTKQSQTIDFVLTGPVNFGDSPTLNATASSGLTVSYTSATPTVCGIFEGSALTTLSTGYCTINADQEGDENFNAAPQVQQTFTIVAVVPADPTNVSAQAGNAQATVSFTPPAFNGGALITTYTVTSSPDSITASGGSSPITVTGLTNGKPYTFTVTATNSAGEGPASTPSGSVTPQGPQTAVNFGSVQVGATSSTIPVTLTFTDTGTVGSSAVLMMGAPSQDFTDAGTGSCETLAYYSKGEACTVDVRFSPKQAGDRLGAVTLRNTGGVPIATAYIYGIGLGPQIAFSPATQTLISSPMGLDNIAVDGSGNRFASAGNYVLKNETTQIGSFAQAGPLAVDGSGNLYVLDRSSSPHRVMKETPQADGTYVESELTSSPYNFDGVAVDSSGNVYVAHSLGYLLKETLNTDGTYTQSQISFDNQRSGPLAIDRSGNLYIADSFTSSVLKETPATTGFTESVVANGSSSPYPISRPLDVKVDGNGNIYILDLESAAANPPDRFIVKLSPSGSQTLIAANSSTSELVRPAGIAVDTASNVWIADTNISNLVKEDVGAPPSLNFGSVTPGGTSSPISVQVINNGSATLSAVNPGLTVTGHFTQVNPGGAPPDCTATFSLAAGAACNLSLEFTPTSTDSGSLSGSTTLTDNNLNASPSTTQVISLAGTAGEPAKQSQTITFNNPGTLSFSSTPITLTATASSNLEVTLTSTTTSVCTVSGHELTTLAAGSCTINADQAGNETYDVAPQVSQTFTIVAVVPGAPTIGTATAGNRQATVTFTPPTFTGGAEITSYVAISSPGGISATGTASSTSITVTGLTNGRTYTFTVQALNSVGASQPSAPSNQVTPNTPQLQSIVVTPDVATIDIGGTQTFTATGYYSDNTSQVLSKGVTWASDSAAATISSKGVAKGMHAGTARISATVGAISGSATLTVNKGPLISIAISPSRPTIAVGSTVSFTVTGTYADRSTDIQTQNATWATSNPAIATVDAGTATAVKVGKATITARIGSLSASATLTVK